MKTLAQQDIPCLMTSEHQWQGQSGKQAKAKGQCMQKRSHSQGRNPALEVDAHSRLKEPEGEQCRAHGGLLLVQQPRRGQPAICMPLVELVLGLHSREAQQASQGQAMVSMPLTVAGPCRAGRARVCSRCGQHATCRYAFGRAGRCDLEKMGQERALM